MGKVKFRVHFMSDTKYIFLLIDIARYHILIKYYDSFYHLLEDFMIRKAINRITINLYTLRNIYFLKSNAVSYKIKH